MAYRRGETDEGLLLQDFADRLRQLEEIASRRVLPPGYQFTYNGSGDLIVKRISDGADEFLIPLGGIGGGASGHPLFIQQTDPALATPYMWVEIDGVGSIVTVWVNT